MKTYSTNEIFRLCDVSRKQLRYYEERGLLNEVPCQDGNNYRYYTHEHIYEIVAEKALKSIDMPLSEMKDIVYGNNIGNIQHSLQQQSDSAKEALHLSLHRYEQSAIVYAHLAEALSVLKLHTSSGEVPAPEVSTIRGRPSLPCPMRRPLRATSAWMWSICPAFRASRRASTPFPSAR